MDKFKLFDDIEEHILKDDIPSIYMDGILGRGLLDEYPFEMLGNLKNIMQNPKFHPEGSVWNHTMLVVNEAAKRKGDSTNSRVFMWAALLHDIGKAPTTRVRMGRITSYKHEIVGENMAVEFLNNFGMDSSFIKNVSVLIRWHMEPLFVIKDLPFSKIKEMLEEASIHEVALLSLCDRYGRGDMSFEKMEDEKKGIELFVKKCREFIEKT